MTTLNDQIVHDIIDNLTLNVKLSGDLLSLLDKEKVALTSMDTQELLRVSKQKSTLLSKIQFLDDTLKNYMADSGQESSPQPTSSGYGKTAVREQFKLSGLIALLPPEKSEVAAKCKDKLDTIRKEIILKNYVNKKFTEDTLGYLGDAIALFTRPVTKKNTYSAAGMRPQRTTTRPQLISQEV